MSDPNAPSAGSGENPAAAYQNHEPGAYVDTAAAMPVEIKMGLAQRPKAPDPMPFAIKSNATGGR
jgi:hypothetical protein